MFRAAALVLALGLPAVPALAQTGSPAPFGERLPGVGAPVRGAGGEMLGRVESITRDSSGRPVQVVVRTRGLGEVRARSRAVPLASLRPEGTGWVVPLRRSEFNLLPVARP